MIAQNIYCYSKKAQVNKVQAQYFDGNIHKYRFYRQFTNEKLKKQPWTCVDQNFPMFQEVKSIAIRFESSCTYRVSILTRLISLSFWPRVLVQFGFLKQLKLIYDPWSLIPKFRSKSVLNFDSKFIKFRWLNAPKNHEYEMVSERRNGQNYAFYFCFWVLTTY